MGNRVEFRNISKYFPGVKALDNISFQAESGYVYAFLGENGAGKSTLLKILNGDYQPDEGSYIINGEEKHFLSPKDAIAGGVSDANWDAFQKELAGKVRIDDLRKVYQDAYDRFIGK